MGKTITVTDEQINEYIELAKVMADHYSVDISQDRYALRIDGGGEDTVVVMFSGEDLVAYTAMVISATKHGLNWE